MATQAGLTFGFQAGPVADIGGGDKKLYGEVIEDAQLGAELGYDSVWMIEHHFTDYYPTPNPFVFLSHIAAHCPNLGLGTSVLVLPWYDPIRFAEEVAMLSLLTNGTLHLGIGRGTAKLEYDAFGINMEEARDRFLEGFRFVRQALTGEAFTFDGEFYKLDRPTKIRPLMDTDNTIFYGAIGSPGSASVMAELGVPPLCISHFPYPLLGKILDTWKETATQNSVPTDVNMPIVVQCYIGDTDEEARREAAQYLPPYFRLQVEHYEIDADPWKGVKGYEQFSKYFANLKKLSDPASIGPYLDLQMVGSPDTVARQIEELKALGFNYIVVSNSTPGVPKEVRHRMLRRFAEEVAPRFAGSNTAGSIAGAGR